MTATASETKRYTLAEYLQTEARAGERYEFYNGEIRPMPGGTISHNRITRNVLSELDQIFKNKTGFEIFGSDQKVYLPHYNFYLYPDAVVVAEKPVSAEQHAHAIINPLLIIEVLSASTEAYDRQQKFLEFRSLPSFREYVLIRQDAPEILSFFREAPDLWRESSVVNLENSVYFRSVDVELALAALYRNVEF
ncbi:MAG: Uma2 family endonuclease [Lewinellaceae bacterium]|nr:Uma2 family endonuclease [Lewinellaceae bacterium]